MMKLLTNQSRHDMQDAATLQRRLTMSIEHATEIRHKLIDREREIKVLKRLTNRWRRVAIVNAVIIVGLLGVLLA
jgi:hypothetical protein